MGRLECIVHTNIRTTEVIYKSATYRLPQSVHSPRSHSSGTVRIYAIATPQKDSIYRQIASVTRIPMFW